MVEPPLLVGALNVTVALVLLPVALTFVGAFGAIGAGMTLFDATDATLVPIALVAVTVKV